MCVGAAPPEGGGPAEEKDVRADDTRRHERLGHKVSGELVNIVDAKEHQRSSRVYAEINEWQSSGLTLERGGDYTVHAEGRWRVGPACKWTGADGRRAKTIACMLFAGKPVKQESPSALVAKIGEDGEPFAVGSELDFTARDGGTLFFRINDTPGITRENAGYVTATVSIIGDPGVPSPTDVESARDAVPISPAEVPDSRAQRWAVVIGISKYEDSRISSLRYASADARAFYDWLVSAEGGSYPPSHVKLLVDESATARNIREVLFSWAGQAIEEDVVTIYFAGHGSPDSPDTPDNLYLLPYDTKYGSIASTGFPMWDIETALERFIDAKRVIVIADACHSGGVGEAFDVARRSGSEPDDNPITSGFEGLTNVGDGVAVISASGGDQFSFESDEYGGGHGVFTFYLLQGLSGEADYNKDERVTLGELIPFLSEQVRRATRNAQTPTVAGRFDPAISLGR